MKKYVFKPYSEIFPRLFDAEKKRIATSVETAALIEHVGSTAIPGLGGKGIIDIAIAVDKRDLETVSKQLQDLGYEFRPTYSTSDRLYFVIYLPDPEEETRRYHVHLTYPECSEWKEFIGFRDYLRNHPKEAQSYAEVKKRAALEANQDGEKYRQLKEHVFQKIKAMTRSKDKITFEVIAYGSDEHTKSVALREEIVGKSLGVSSASAELELKDCIHIAGFLGQDLCATAILVPEGDEIKMQRVATRSHLQNRGIGSALLVFCEKYAREQGYKSIYCHAKGTAVPFYLKNKYVLEGEPFVAYGIPHQKMRKTLL
jgi:GrpB-like predicted nucleotidyltransferase (UPF0157 family)